MAEVRARGESQFSQTLLKILFLKSLVFSESLQGSLGGISRAAFLIEALSDMFIILKTDYIQLRFLYMNEFCSTSAGNQCKNDQNLTVFNQNDRRFFQVIGLIKVSEVPL